MTVRNFLDELARCDSIQAAIVNTSPPDYRKKTVLLKLQALQRAISITRQYLEKIKAADAVLLFATNQFIFTLGPVLLWLARWYHKPFYLKPFGGDLDLYLAGQKKPLRNLMLNILYAMNGMLVQTRQVQEALTQLHCPNVHYVPGYRSLSEVTQPQNSRSEELRLIFLSHIKREKGPLILLKALRSLAQGGSVKITCDFYGPIFAEDREEFFRCLEATPRARYCGVVEVGGASRLIAAYDALVLPTFFISEGHPGVIIEAMRAGVPVISTQHRAIPELITHGQNGFLIPVQNSQALAEAIKHIALDRPLRKRMGQSNYRRGEEFRAELIVPQILGIIFPIYFFE